MKHTMKIYTNSPEHSTYLKARFDRSNKGHSFEWAGHRWAYEHTGFDDDGDYDLLYRFDDKPYPEDVPVVVAADDMTLRDYFAAKALQGMLSNQGMWDLVNEKHAESVARDAYQVADAMLRAREAS